MAMARRAAAIPMRRLKWIARSPLYKRLRALLQACCIQRAPVTPRVSIRPASRTVAMA